MSIGFFEVQCCEPRLWKKISGSTFVGSWFCSRTKKKKLFSQLFFWLKEMGKKYVFVFFSDPERPVNICQEFGTTFLPATFLWDSPATKIALINFFMKNFFSTSWREYCSVNWPSWEQIWFWGRKIFCRKNNIWALMYATIFEYCLLELQKQLLWAQISPNWTNEAKLRSIGCSDVKNCRKEYSKRVVKIALSTCYPK